MRVGYVMAIILAAALAGCTDDGGADGDTNDGDGTVMEGEQDDGTGAEPVPDLQEPVQQDWFFTPSETLQNETPPAGSITIPGGYTSFVSGASFPMFQSPPVEAPTLLLPEPVDMTLYVQSSGPGIQDPLFTYGVWIGSSHSMPVIHIESSPAPVAPGTVNEVSFTVEWGADLLPIMMAPGDSLRVDLAISYDGASDAGMVELLTGDETPSKATFTTQTYNIDPFASAAQSMSEEFTGTLSNGSFTECAAQEGVNYDIHRVAVSDNASYLRVDSSGSDASGGGDLDIDLFDGSAWLGGGHTATADEGILLAGDRSMQEIRGKTLDLRVSVCVAAQMDYNVTVEQG